MFEILRLLSQVVSASITSSSRPALTFVGIQVFVAVRVNSNWASLPEDYLWLISSPAIIVAVIFALGEFFFQHDETVAELMQEVHIDKMLSVFGAFSSALLFVSLGLPENEASALIVHSDGIGLAEAAHELSTHEHASAIKVGAIFGSVGLNLILSHYRSKAFEWLSEIELAQWARQFETGGVALALLLIIFAPIISLLIFIVMMVSLCVVGGGVAFTSQQIDKRSRRPCPSCNEKIRCEAFLCHYCQSRSEPTEYKVRSEKWTLAILKKIKTNPRQSPLS